MAFTDEELERYARHIVLREIGYAGQKKLAAAKVLIVGAGGLGAPAALYLAAAGVGTLGIADDDAVELSNLQRQIIHAAADVGRKKVDSAAEKLRALNPGIEVRTYPARLTAANAAALIAPYDLVLDGTDNFAAKFLINDACVMAKKPYVHAGVLRFEGQVMTVIPGAGPCLRCVFGEPPADGGGLSCGEAGVVGAAVGVIGALQALEAVKLITGAGEPLVGRMLMFDGLSATFRTVELPPRGDGCAVCSERPTVTELTDYALPACARS